MPVQTPLYPKSLEYIDASGRTRGERTAKEGSLLSQISAIEAASHRLRLFAHSAKRAPERAKQLMAPAAAQALADYERAVK